MLPGSAGDAFSTPSGTVMMARRARTSRRERSAAVWLSISTAPRVQWIPVTMAEVEIDARIGSDRAFVTQS